MEYRKLVLPAAMGDSEGCREWRTPDGRWRVFWLGRVSYEGALCWQEQIVEGKVADLEAEDVMLLLEHDPVYTIGRSPDRSSLGVAEGGGIPVIEINRGGKATYHGPGQLVGYPLFDLRRGGRDLHRYLRSIETGLSESVGVFGVQAGFREGLTGVWVGNRKLASIGVGVRRWIAMHGFALNVAEDLSGFGSITPCGITGVEMTSLSREAGRTISVEEFAAVVAERLPKYLS
jgi:lipoyl(octanoyl) transferase